MKFGIPLPLIDLMPAMLSHLANHVTEIKLTITAMIGFAAWLADTSPDIKGWEEASLKVLLILAVIFIGKLFLEAQRNHKAEIEKVWENHKAEIAATKEAHKQAAELREARLVSCLSENTKCLSELTALTKDQTDYFKAVTRNVVNEKLNGGKPTLP